MSCGAYEVFTIAVVVIAIAMVLFAIMFNPRLVEVNRTDVEHALNKRSRTGHAELVEYMDEYYPKLSEHVKDMLVADSYKFILEHFERPEPNSFDLMDEIASRILEIAKSGEYGDYDGQG